MRESRTYGSVRGALSNERPYRDRSVPTIIEPRLSKRGGHGAGAPLPALDYAAGAVGGEVVCCMRWKRSTCCAVEGRRRS